jgi:Xaa-Pro aminopeptidase
MGGVRIEDVVLVTKTGMKKLTQYPNFLEIS